MKKIKIAPSTKTGSHHWMMQRVSAVALIPLILWFSYSFVMIIQDVEANMAVFFAYPFNAVMSIILVATSLYHGSLGMQVVFEDYVANKFMRMVMIVSMHFISLTTAVVAVLAILKLHLVG